MIINSKYKVLKILGKGRSDVYLVEDAVAKGNFYALKVISSTNITDEEFYSIRNEFRLLSRITHPNIVQAYEFGKIIKCDNKEFIGSYYYITEYIRGKNLLDFFHQPLNKNNINKFLIALNQICSTLYYIHQLGIIHYDIKPENILIDERTNGQLQVKLIDFGFSTLKSKKARGTPFYISPELITKKNIDHRTDLYSLGATLYHLLSGKLPFYSNNDVELLKKHLEEEPEPLSDDIPEYLQFVIFTLLRKNPEERFDNSLEIIDHLPENYRQLKNIWPIPKIYSARESDLNKIKSWFENEDTSTQNLFLISERGMGRSFLLKKFAEYLEDLNKPFFYLKSSEDQATSYNLLFGLLYQIEYFITHQDIANKNELLDKVYFTKQVYQNDENRLEFHQYQQNYLAEILIELAKQINYTFIIDDFQKFDSTSKKYFFFINPVLTDLRIKFLISADTSITRTIEIEKFQNYQEIIIVPLSRDEVIQMLQKYFQLSFPYDEVADLINEFTDNSMKEISEFLNNLIISEILIFNSSGFRIDYKKLKDFNFETFLSQTYEIKINNLSKNQRLILEILSLINFTIKQKRLSDITKIEAEQLKSDISYLASFGWIEYSGKDEIVYLPEGGIKNFLYSKTKNDKELNLTLAKYFEQNKFPPFITAEFYERANIWQKALEYYLKSVVEAEQFFSYSMMEKYILKCLELERNISELTILKIKLAQCYFYQSEFQKAQFVIEDILNESLLKKDELFNLYLMLAIINFKTGNPENAYENLDKAYIHATTDQQRIEVEINQINLEVSQGNFNIASKKCENLLNEFDEILSQNTKAAIYNNLGITNSQAGFFQNAISYFEQALQIYDQLKNKMKLSQVLLNLGNVYNLLGNKDKALENWNAALRINDSIGDLSKNALILNNIGILLFEAIKIEDAIKYYQEAKSIFEKINDSFGASLASFNLAEAYFLTCEYELALTQLNQALTLSQKVIDIEGLCQGLFLYGLIYYQLSKLKDLQQVSNELLTTIENHKMESSHLQYYLYLSGLLDFEEKNVTDAEIKLNLAKELLRESNGKYFYCKCTLDLMNIYSYQGNFNQVQTLFNELKNNSYFKVNDLLQAEYYLILGDISKKPGSNLNESAIYYYTEALKHVEQTIIGEITWQVLVALGEEYLVKGAINKGIELFKQAQLVIEYISSKIKDNENKNSYLANLKRKKSLEKIEKVINHF